MRKVLALLVLTLFVSVNAQATSNVEHTAVRTILEDATGELMPCPDSMPQGFFLCGFFASSAEKMRSVVDQYAYNEGWEAMSVWEQNPTADGLAKIYLYEDDYGDAWATVITVGNATYGNKKLLVVYFTEY